LRPLAGWECRHITERTIFLVKDDVAYRKYTGWPGFVLHRVEPGTPHEDMVDQAYAIAERNDAELGLRLGEELLPVDFKIRERAAKHGSDAVVVSVGGQRIFSLPEYRAWQAAFRPVFATPEDPQIKVYRP
jgi:hypothetical protein